MALDLPISDIMVYVNDALQQFGSKCQIDGSATYIMMSNIDKQNTNDNLKQAVISKNISVKKGSKIVFDDGKVAIVYTVPNDDMVSYSSQLLMCNGKIQLLEENTVYDENTGKIISKSLDVKKELDGYIERESYDEKNIDLGLSQEERLKFVTFIDNDVKINDLVLFKDKKYKVIDIDNVVDGLLIIRIGGIKL